MAISVGNTHLQTSKIAKIDIKKGLEKNNAFAIASDIKVKET